jgi:hypothetical protein
LEATLQARSAHPTNYQQPASFTTLTVPGEWPKAAVDLPLVLDQRQYAHLRAVSVRTLQRERRLGRSIAYRKIGKRIFYARADVLAGYGVDGIA